MDILGSKEELRKSLLNIFKHFGKHFLYCRLTETPFIYLYSRMDQSCVLTNQERDVL